jgi:hypothetical protein
MISIAAHMHALSGIVGIYSNRLGASHKAYMSKEECNNRVDKASLKKLAKTPRILSFRVQKKVYLFWKSG